MQSKLLAGFRLDGRGSGTKVDAEAMSGAATGDELLWLHFDYKDEATHQWLKMQSGLDSMVIEALLAQDTRPRYLSSAGGLLVILRGVNLNPGADSDDMVSVRIWLEPHRIFSIYHRRVMAVDDIRNSIAAGDGPLDAGDFLCRLTDGLASRIGYEISNIDDAVDEMEDEVLEDLSLEHRSELSELRRQIIRIRRYLAPQREVMFKLHTESNCVLTDVHKRTLRENAEHITRYLEDLDSAKDRAAVCQEELEHRINTQMNRTLYILSIITTIFLPLGLITGLLGINVGGIPGSENPFAFSLVCVVLVVIAIVQVLVFRRVHWV